MRPVNNKRSRGGRSNNRRPHIMGGGGGGGGNRSFDSNGPDVKIRGTAAQIFDRYCQLARDANSSGDRVAAENFLQHAEHYYRIMLANGLVNQQRNQQQNGQPNGNGNGNGQGDEEGGEEEATTAAPQQGDVEEAQA
jgi:hypothetical protein